MRRAGCFCGFVPSRPEGRSYASEYRSVTGSKMRALSTQPPSSSRMKTTRHHLTERQREALTDALEQGALAHVRIMLGSLAPGEIATLLESLPPAQRSVAWELVDPEYEGEILVGVTDEVRDWLISESDDAALVAAAETMELDDLADILAALPDRVTHQLLDAMDRVDRERLEAALSFDKDTAGGLMNPDTLSVRPDVSVDVVLRYLRMRGAPEGIGDNLIVVDRYETYVGAVSLARLITSAPETRVGDILAESMDPIPAIMPAGDVAKIFEERDLISAPVVDERNRVLGRITIDDVVDVIREEGEKTLLSMSGLAQDADMFAPVWASARRRAVWLGVNLATAFLAAWVIGLFEHTIREVVALAVLMPVVASMGGIAGSQTLTLVIRGMALGQLGHSNARYLMVKEALVAALNGLRWATVVAAVAVAWFGRWEIGAVIAVAIALNLLAAAGAGVMVPLGLRRFGVDPALAGGVVLTTVMDVVGFAAFLGLGALFLL